MAKIKAILKEFTESLKTNDYTKFLALIRQDPKCLRNGFGTENKTLLHYLCAINIEKINFGKNFDSEVDKTLDQEEMDWQDIDEDAFIAMLDGLIDEFDCDLNIRDKKGNTPLHYATYSESERVVKLLLEFEDTEVNAENKAGTTALQIAVSKEFSSIEKLLLDVSKQQISEQEIPQGLSVREYQRLNKKSIIDLGPLTPLKSDKPTAIQAIESSLYIQDSKLREQFAGQWDEVAQNEVLIPLINFLGLCVTRGTVDESRRLTLFKEYRQIKETPPEEEYQDIYDLALKKIEKELGMKFKIICVDAEDVGSLKPFSHEPRGLYTNKNSVFAATRDLEINGVLGLIMHESSHFTMHQLFKNSAKPYPKNDLELQQKYEKIVEITKDSLKTMLTGLADEQDEAAFEIINNVFKVYPQNEWEAELIVRVPEIMGSLGPDAGQKWLQKNSPELYGYYENVVNPAISNYLQDHNAAEYLFNPEINTKSLG
ncbi:MULTISPECIES: ankyrin repeat domain-containing protein [Legionella]|uniref:Ankyrin repeats (3 copies) n=1 Tax=Legionella drozanskii LLAP-1 TaxID=1212489 RepID=A0A0W0T856_9GAMM|nr:MULTISPECIES: ankyrin repeat domain-containing protein [Legionella]KTC91790.1 Ankyrin repeats (3 copies) [Legionella drozanskii LLAP-1]PJE17995.1 MAG: hypothetical protein CK430_01120 [Legionella sp.]